MSPMDQLTFTKTISFPRVSGDEPQGRPPGFARAQFSPRERG